MLELEKVMFFIAISPFILGLPMMLILSSIGEKLDRIYVESLMVGKYKKIKIDSRNFIGHVIGLSCGLSFILFIPLVPDDSIPFIYGIIFFIFIIGLFGHEIHGILQWRGKINTIELFQNKDYFVYTSHFFKSYEIKYSDIDYIEFYVIGEGLKRFEIIENVPVKYIKIHTNVKTFKLYIHHVIGAKYFLEKL